MKPLKIGLTLFLFAAGFLFQSRAGAQILMPNSVHGNGGTAISNSSHRIVGTLGQPTIGEVSNSSNIMQVGFWYIPTLPAAPPLWTQLPTPTTETLRSVHFVNANQGWTVGYNGTILHTSNGGENWSPQNPGTSQVHNYLAVRFVDANIGWAGGGKVVSRTTDGGVTWGGIEQVLPNPFRNSLFPVSSTQAWAPASGSGTRLFLRYTVQGNGSLLEESFCEIASAAVLYDIYFVDPDNGWAVGSPGQIVRITNASTSSPSCANQTSGTTAQLNAIHMLDANNGWIAGNGGVILKTTNGGTNWTSLNSGTTTKLNDVHFNDLNNGWVVGDNGLILTTSDGGNSWTPETSGVTTILRSVFFAGPGYVVGDNGVVLKRTTGAGNTATVAFATTASSVAENVSPATVTVTLTTSDGNPSSSDVTVNYATSDGTATAGSDYTSTSNTLTFPAGSVSGSTQAINVPILDDLIDEPDETFMVTLSNPVGGSLGTPSTHTVTINDDEVPSISINDVSITEGNTGTVNAVFTVSLSGASSQIVTADYATADGTATAGSDYVGGSGTLTFNPDETAKNVTVLINGDLIKESDETFFVNLSNSSNATIQKGQGVGTVLNDDVTTVANANDSGPGSLRQAILVANSSSGVDLIDFNITGTGPHTISLLSALPTLTDPVIIDGTTQTGFAGTPIIELNGTNAGGDGLKITTGNSTIKGLVINRFNNIGIFISGEGANENVIQGNYVGTDVTGTAGLGNSYGIWISGGSRNVIGGTTEAARNLIGGNGYVGVYIYTFARDNVVQGNYIGTNVTGEIALGNGTGVAIDDQASNNTIGGTNAGARNVISGNRHGVTLAHSANDNIVQGNFIGTNAAGTADLGNTDTGVTISGANNNSIGGTISGAGNTISGNDSWGIVIENGASGNLIQGNFIGTDVTATTALGNGEGVLLSEALGNTIGSTTGARNIISGNSFGISIAGANSTGNLVQGNYIGTDVTGTVDLGNSIGVRISDASNNTIGGTLAGAGNVISGNDFRGVEIYAAGNQVLGNFIGTQADGVSPLGNITSGVFIGSAGSGGANNNTIGGEASGAGNTIAFNGGDGVYIDPYIGIDNAVRANRIHNNGDLGIDLGPNGGVTPNDAGDGDTGPNNLQNFPVITSAITSGSTTTLQGTLDTPSPETATIELFSNTTLDPSGHGEGQTFLGTATPDAAGNWSMVLPMAIPIGQFITATATDAAGNTSEFSAGVVVTQLLPSLSINDVTVTEGNSGTVNAIFTVSLSTASSQQVTVDYSTADETATAGSDYVAIPTTSLIFPPNTTTQTVTVIVNGDQFNEPDETFLVNLANPTNASIADNQGQGTITNDDLPPSLSINDVSIPEGNTGTTNAVLTVTLSSASGQTVTVDYATADGSATAGSDYTAVSGTLTFPPETTTQTIPVPVIGDVVVEPNENFYVNLSNPSNTTIDDEQGECTILDNDAIPPSITSFNPACGPVGTVVVIVGNNFLGATQTAFNGVAASFTVDSNTQITATVPSGATTGKISVTTPSGTAFSTNDFSVTPSQIVMNPTDDAYVRSDQPTSNFGTLAFLGMKQSSPIVNSYLKFVVSGVCGVVQSAKLRMTVTFASSSGGSIYAVSNNYNGTSNPWNETGLNYSNAPVISGTPLDTKGSVTVGQVVEFDLKSTITGNGTFSFGLNNASTTMVRYSSEEGANKPELVLQIGPPVPPPSITFFNPTNGPIGTIVTITGNNFLGATQVAFNGVTSVYTVDSNTQITATVPSGATTGKISVTTPSGTALSTSDFTVTVLLPSLSISDVSIPEGNTGTTNAVFTVTLSAASGQTVTVDYATADGSATAGSDYTAVSGTLTFPLETTTQTIPVPVIGDVVVEPNENFYVNLSNPTHATITDGQGECTILNDDPIPPTIASFNPTNGPIGTVVTITGNNFLGATQVAFNGVTSVYTVDSNTQITATVPSGATTGKISVTTPSGTALSASDFTVTVPLPSLSINDVSIPEDNTGTTNAVFTVTLSAASEQTVTVDYATADGSAIAGSDYTAVSGTLTFPPETTTQTIPVPVIGDVVTEPNENFYVNLSNPTNATIDDGQGECTILDDDATPPSVTSFNPTCGPVGTVVVVTGNNFLGATQVAFNGVASVYTVDFNTQITATVPSGATTGKISVTTPSGTALSASDFTVTPPQIVMNPTDDAYVRSDQPTSNFGTITFLGMKQSSPIVNSYLKFVVSGVCGVVQSAKLHMTVTFASSSGGSIYAVSNNYNGTSNPWNETGLNYSNAPVISGTPLDTKGSVTVSQVVEFDLKSTITGNGTFSFGLNNASTTMVRYSSKEGATKPELVLQIGPPVPPPSITFFNPTNGPIGTVVTITGNNFLGATQVAFNGVTSVYTVDSNTQITATVPSGATTGKISVTTPSGTALSTSDFTVTVPLPSLAISDVSIPEGNTGTTNAVFTVTLSAASGQTVTVDYATADGSATAGSDYTAVSGTLTFPPETTTQTIPVPVIGDVVVEPNEDFFVNLSNPSNATITDGQGECTILDDDAIPPSITSFNPTCGPVGTVVVITGNNFLGATQVAFNGVASVYTVDSNTQITATVPSGATTGKISVTTPSGTALSASDFTVTPPQIVMNPTDDAYVRSDQPTSNFGTLAFLGMKQSSPIVNSYLKFVVSGVCGVVQSAKLRMTVTFASSSGGSIYAVSNNYNGTSNPWNETGLNYSNAPVISGTPLDTKGSVTVGQVVEFDLKSTIAGNGTFSFGLNNASTTMVRYSSEEGANKPELVLQIGVSASAKAAEVSLLSAELQNEVLPEKFNLSPNYPNPFNAQTLIEYALPEAVSVRLTIYNVLGQLVRTLVDETQPAGYKRVFWDGRNALGNEAGSGVYFVQLDFGRQRMVRKMVLQR